MQQSKTIVNLVCHAEALSYPGQVDTVLEKGMKLSEYIPACEKLTYNYDFGDDWNHEIEVEKIIENYDSNYPIAWKAKGIHRQKM